MLKKAKKSTLSRRDQQLEEDALDACRELIGIIRRLRAPGGCPWDRAQTHSSILTCLVEEAYEYCEAVNSRDLPNMREELGDVLLQVVLHSRMAEQAGTFTLAEVARGISEKLVRRHPHVFGAQKIGTPEGVRVNWDRIKELEKGAPRLSILDGLTRGLPPLQKAEKIQRKVGKTGFDWKDYRGPLAKVREELRELNEEIGSTKPARRRSSRRQQEEFGDLLFAMVNLGRHLHLDPSTCLSLANLKFERRFRQLEKMVAADGRKLQGMTLREMDRYWDRAKLRRG